MELLLAKAVLAGVFGVAAIAKLADREGVRRSLVTFGVPGGLAARLGWALVCCELAVASALLAGPAARAGALGALAVLAVFSVAVAWNIRRGRRPDCHCFGRLRSAPVGWPTVARNAALAAVAGFVAAEGRAPLIFAGCGLVAASLWVGPELRRFSRLRPGAVAPSFSLSDETGEAWTLEVLLARRAPLMLVFSDPACGACRHLAPEVARWQEDLADRLNVALVSAGSPEEHVASAPAPELRLLLIDADRSVAVAYGVSATPSAVLIDGERRIAAAPAVGAEEIARLVAHVVETAEDIRLERRALLRSAAAGVGSVVVLRLVASAAAAARAVRPRALKIDGAWLCDQRYALCTSAPCTQSETDPKIGVCDCVVKRGYSVGFKSCKRRAPRGDQLHSNFSLQNVTSRTRVMTCAARGVWTQCLDVVCQVDPENPKRATCQCVRMETKNFLTFGGNCDASTCSSVIWSATTSPFPGGAQYEKGLKRLGIPYRTPNSCPSPARST